MKRYQLGMVLNKEPHRIVDMCLGMEETERGVYVLHSDAAAIQAQRDRLVEMLKKYAPKRCYHCVGMGIDMREEVVVTCPKCEGSGSAYPDGVAELLAEISKESEKC